MFRNFKRPIWAPSSVITEKQIKSTPIVDENGNTSTVCEVVDVSHDDIDKNLIDCTIVTPDSIVRSGNTIQGNITLDVTDAATIEMSAASGIHSLLANAGLVDIDNNIKID